MIAPPDNQSLSSKLYKVMPTNLRQTLISEIEEELASNIVAIHSSEGAFVALRTLPEKSILPAGIKGH